MYLTESEKTDKKVLIGTIILLVSVTVVPILSSSNVSADGVIIQEGVHLDPSDSNTLVNFTGTQTFSMVDVKNDSVVLSTNELKTTYENYNSNIYVNIQEWNGLNRTFTMKSTANQTVDIELNNLIPNTRYQLSIDGNFTDGLVSNKNGNISFSHSEWSTHEFSLTVENTPTIKTLEPKTDSRHEVEFSGDVTLNDFGEVYVYFQYRKKGDLSWDNTKPKLITEDGEVKYTLNNESLDFVDDRYEYRAVVDYDGGVNYGDSVDIEKPPVHKAVSDSVSIFLKVLIPLVIVFFLIKYIASVFGGLLDNVE